MQDFIDYLVEHGKYHKISDDGKITVGEYLDLEGTSITRLPEGLYVGGSLDLRGTGITSLPKSFTCDSLHLNHAKITNCSYRENCGDSKRTIFSVKVSGKYLIAAGCFFNDLENFELAVDSKYSGDAAEKYKQQARDCVEELKLKLGE